MSCQSILFLFHLIFKTVIRLFKKAEENIINNILEFILIIQIKNNAQFKNDLLLSQTEISL